MPVEKRKPCDLIQLGHNAPKMKVAALIALLSCLLLFGLRQTTVAAERGAIKIGFIAPLTGNFARAGMDMVTGAKMFLEEINYSVAGRKIELIFEDDAANPKTAVTKLRKFLDLDKVDMIAGEFLAPCAYAIAPICEEAGIPFINTNAASDDLTQRKRTKTMIRLCYTSCQIGHVAGDYAYKKLGWRSVPTLGWEHAFGQEVIGSFERVFEDAGGRVIQRLYVPLTTLDFSPYVSSLKRYGDGVFTVITGSASLRLMKTLKASGIMDKWKVLTCLTAVDETFLQELGDTALGVLSIDGYSAVLDNPANVKFRKRVKDVTRGEANSTILYAYDGLNWISRALKEVNGDTGDKNKLMKALRSVEIPDSPRGPMKLDDYGQIVQNIYVRRVDKVANYYQNTVLATYPMVSQFWTYPPEAFLKEPVYSRDWPACKFCE